MNYLNLNYKRLNQIKVYSSLSEVVECKKVYLNRLPPPPVVVDEDEEEKKEGKGLPGNQKLG